ncbi:MAG: DUF3298 domain-containing protein [Prevotella sp.]|nr:DUF3298 domain-containing protein [Prevotella sp.]
MKKIKLFAIAAAMALVAGCSTEKVDKGICLEHFSTDKYYNVNLADSLRMKDSEYSLHNIAKIVWPTSIDGEVPTDLQRAIMKIAFNDSVSTTLKEAMEKFEKTGYGLREEETTNHVATDSTHANKAEIMNSVRVEMAQANDKLYVFSIFNEGYFAGAAHGMYTQWFVNYDRINKKVVTLESLFTDKEKLRKLLEAKRKEDLKEQGVDNDHYMLDDSPFPVSESFEIEGSCITFTYQPYDIASYAEGMQTVRLYFYDMNEAGILTPYAKKLLE